MITIAIIDDHKVLIDTLSLMIHNHSKLELIGSAGTLAEGRSLLRQASPDVLLLDIGLPDGNGLVLVKEAKKLSPTTHIIVLTSFSDENTLMGAIDKGVSGFITKHCSIDELLTTIWKAVEGEIVMPTSLLFGLVKRYSRDKAAGYREKRGWEPLTPRELEILELLASGKPGERIAEELHITHLTVRTHIRNLMAKLGTRSRLEAVSFGLRHGLITLSV